MNKKVMIGIILAIMIIIVGCIGYTIYRNNQNSNNEVQANNIDTGNDSKEDLGNTNKKILVVYYSAQKHTKVVAEKIARNLNADIFEIVPKKEYTEEDLDWTNSNSRVSKEHDNIALREIELKEYKIENFEKYDTILIGYPIWWGNAAWPVNTFVKTNDFSGKTIIPFCTSSSSGLGQSGKLLEQEANSGNWLEGHRFNSNPTDSDIDNWTDSLK